MLGHTKKREKLSNAEHEKKATKKRQKLKVNIQKNAKSKNGEEHETRENSPHATRRKKN